MTRSAKDPFPFADSIGPFVCEEKKRQHLTDGKLAKRAGVSRRHLGEMQKGANASLLTALKVMQALGIVELPFHSGERLIAPPKHLDTGALLSAVEQLEQGAALILSAASTVRAAVGASDADRPSDKLAARAASLIDDFGAFVRGLGSEAQFDALENVIQTARLPQSANATKRRKTTA